MSRNRVLMKRRPQFVEFLACAKNNEEECSNGNQEHEMKQQHGVTSKPVVVAGDFGPNIHLIRNLRSDRSHGGEFQIPVSISRVRNLAPGDR